MINRFKELELLNDAFQMERDSYLRTIHYLRKELMDAGDKDTEKLYELAKDKVTELLAENDRLLSENEKLEAELAKCGKKLNAIQYKEYKRLKQKEYNERWRKKKAAQAK